MHLEILRGYEIKFHEELIKRIKEETTDFSINRGNKYRGWAIVNEIKYQRYPAIYKPDGTIETLESSASNMGLRLIGDYSDIKDKGKTKKDFGDGLLEIEYGEYPQEAVELEKQENLDYDLLNGRLTSTGKTYTTHDNQYSQALRIPEMADENGNKYVNKNNTWYKVSPVQWIVDVKTNKAMSKYILTGGVSFGDLNPTRYHYEYMLKSPNNIYGYLKVLAKELEPSIVLKKLDITIPTIPYKKPIEPCDPIPGRNPWEPCDPIPGRNPWEPCDPIPGRNPWEPCDPIPGRNPWEPCDPIPGRNPWEITDPVPIKSPFTPFDPTKGPKCEEKVKKIGSK